MIHQFISSSLISITPSDSTDLPAQTKAIYIGTGGAITLIGAGDSASVTLSVANGTLLPIRAKKVLATGTTATGIVGLL